MKLLIIPIAAVATLFFSAPAADAQSLQQQQRDRMANIEGDRVASELSGSGLIRDRRGRTLSAGQVTNGAKSAVVANGLSCDVTESALRGVTNAKNDLWEVACQGGVAAGGAGYMITSPKKEEVYECANLAEQAKQAEAAGQKVPEIAVCRLTTNQAKS